ncbi:hypothetical protein TTHERM_00733990 (macronuclear) [Tetrahymena thermophila SB210]|uniref:Uncharacterized protein n=1 Tax=Tetrahymena thermophila (strain SB210) TaxID=312017 RepID=Q231Z8_TETTS|nr:hypothetical protein TTHERM_00733990 [Tetrahymena thermophila SB210]EAR91302.1 hypothetical protein TTHERM_00733990 [Tetrahymena thermophila SB210]|eukprot:XP_001011547.1 hypothetical protein TTHERM_00733990 [Tetrahymena thermophila SB210]
MNLFILLISEKSLINELQNDISAVFFQSSGHFQKPITLPPLFTDLQLLIAQILVTLHSVSIQLSQILLFDIYQKSIK